MNYFNIDGAFLEGLRGILSEDQIGYQVNLGEYTSFKIGGPADVFVEPSTIEQVSALIGLCREWDMPYFVLGNGSNILVTDEGYRGMVIHLYRNFNRYQIEDDKIVAEAGITLAALANHVANHRLTGLEFASGIPGTLGGAVFMNAGAYGGEMRQVVTRVVAVDEEGDVISLDAVDLAFGYRHSRLQEDGLIALEVEMQLHQGDESKIRDYMKELNQRRKDKQPLELPSAGSTFKRPEGYFAGKLIMDSGLSGYRIGDAMVSDKHCGFVVNMGQASFLEVHQLIQHVQKVVYERYHVRLHREVKIIGQNSDMYIAKEHQ